MFELASYDATFASRTTPDDWQRILRFRSSPRFLEALKTYHALIPQYFSDNVVLNKVVTEAWRFEMLVYTLYLHDTRETANPRSGLTTTNLEKICAQQKCASKGRVLAILGIMRLGGYLRQKKSEIDSRIKHLEPTAKFLSIVEGWNNRILQIIDAVYPEGALAQAHAQNPAIGRNMRTRGAEGLLAGFKLLDPFPEVFHFVSSDGGWMLLLHLVAESLRRGEYKSIAPVEVDLAAYGKRFSASRSHLRRLLESAYEKEILTAPPRNGSDVRLSPITVSAFLSCMASELDFYRGNAVGN
ncbi:MAG: hypothetical protein KGO94_06695 [Alphaproteobacteria bacterium]|nr:hypothetical protein [Alphaproteobacteria bacterium]